MIVIIIDEAGGIEVHLQGNRLREYINVSLGFGGQNDSNRVWIKDKSNKILQDIPYEMCTIIYK